MSLIYDTPNKEKLERIILAKGYTVPRFTASIYGEGKGRNVIKELETRPDMRSSTLVKVCRLLNISIDTLFSDSNDGPSIQTIDGDYNIVNSNVASHDIAMLRAEVDALRTLLTEKDLRIKELKEANSDLNRRLDFLLKLGQKLDE